MDGLKRLGFLMLLALAACEKKGVPGTGDCLAGGGGFGTESCSTTTPQCVALDSCNLSKYETSTTGAPGATGATGLQGPQGNVGAPGPSGLSGPQGTQGPNGTNGQNATANVYTLGAVLACTPAAASYPGYVTLPSGEVFVPEYVTSQAGDVDQVDLDLGTARCTYQRKGCDRYGQLKFQSCKADKGTGDVLTGVKPLFPYLFDGGQVTVTVVDTDHDKHCEAGQVTVQIQVQPNG